MQERKIIFILLSFILSIYCWNIDDINNKVFGNNIPNEPFACWNTCMMPITWTSPLSACGLDGQVYYNILGNSTLSSYLQCLVKNIGLPDPNIGMAYPGPCGCPNSCSNITSQGTCISGQCECNNGWTGIDCSQVSSDNTCSNVGTITSIDNNLTCNCTDGYALNDCSANVSPLPPITQTITPVEQYTSKDDYGNNNPIFNTSTIAQIYLTMPEDVLTYQLQPENQQSDTYFPVKMAFYNGPTTQIMDKVGFRLKGGASRTYVKKTWKLSFNKFEDGRKWAQQKKLSLKALQQDESGIKEALVLSLLYSMNAPAQRYGYAQVFINGENMGIYLILENIDDQYLDSRVGGDKGAFYKCLGDLAYLGWDPELYANATVGSSKAYGPENDAAENYELLRDFIKVINVTSDEDFVNLLPNIFDIDLYLRTLVVEVLTGNWDGLWNGNNYFLYYNKDIDKFQYLRHDLEISFGTWDTFYGMIDKPIATWGDGGRGYRLINRVLATEPFKSQFKQYCHDLIDTYFNLESNFISRMTALNSQISPLVYRDQWRMTDFAYSYDEFLNLPDKSVIRESGSNYIEFGYPYVITYGIKQFMNVRIATALEQLANM